MQGVKDSSSLYEVERRAYYGQRPGFRIAELQISPTQKIPWHLHTNVHDTFYVVEGVIRIFLQDPKEDLILRRGQTFTVPPKRPHLVTMQAMARPCFSSCKAPANTTSCRSLKRRIHVDHAGTAPSPRF